NTIIAFYSYRHSIDSNELLHFGNFFCQRFSHRTIGNANYFKWIVPNFPGLNDPEYPRFICMELVKAQLIFCIKQNEHTHGKTDTQSGDFYNRESFVAPDVAECDLEIIS